MYKLSEDKEKLLEVLRGHKANIAEHLKEYTRIKKDVTILEKAIERLRKSDG